MFEINNNTWYVMFKNPNNSVFTRSDGSTTVGVTDGKTNVIYLSSALKGKFMERVLCHELCHAICFSYDINIPIESEELIADWVSLYGREVINILDEILKSLKKGIAI